MPLHLFKSYFMTFNKVLQSFSDQSCGFRVKFIHKYFMVSAIIMSRVYFSFPFLNGYC